MRKGEPQFHESYFKASVSQQCFSKGGVQAGSYFEKHWPGADKKGTPAVLELAFHSAAEDASGVQCQID